MRHPDRIHTAVLVAMLLLSCGACSQQRWTFARRDLPIGSVQADQARLHEVPPPMQPSPISPAPAYPNPEAYGVIPAGGVMPVPTFAPQDQSVFNSSRQPWHGASQPPRGFGTPAQSKLARAWDDIRQDHASYYSWSTLRDLTFAVALAAPLANTSADEGFQDWYQDDLRSSGTDNFASFWKTFGEGQIFIPAFAGLALVGGIYEDRPLLGGVGEFGNRVTRSYLLGAPPTLFMQALLGGSRPNEDRVGSQWKPFDDSNAVSGHAFVGAVPFITAAKMTDRSWVKGTLYVCSTFPAWSRVNDDAHYLSQICLGWWMAYMSCRAVETTEQAESAVTFTPMVTPEMSGMAMTVRR